MQPTTQPGQLPKETPSTAFGAGEGDQDPMRNFGYTVAAYSVLWAILLGFVVLSWRRQAALDARIGELEAAVKAKGKA
jgi:CcmD family protein